MNDVLIDTSILIDALNSKESAIKYVESFGVVTISIVTYAEIVNGALNKKDVTNLSKLLDSYNTISIEENISKSALELVIKYNSSDGLVYTDALIAATCIQNDLSLATKDKKHFKNIKEIELIIPY